MPPPAPKSLDPSVRKVMFMAPMPREIIRAIITNNMVMAAAAHNMQKEKKIISTALALLMD